MHLQKDLYYYPWRGKGNNCNTYLFAGVLRGGRPHILVDPGHIVNEMGERCWEQLVNSLKRDGFPVADIGLVINTHSHLDHCEANERIVEMTRAGGVRGKAVQALITLHKEEEEYRRAIGWKMRELLRSKAEFEPSFYLQEGELNLGKGSKLSLKVFHCAGHSPGSICLYWGEGKVLIGGDTIFVGSVGRTDLPGGNIQVLKQSIERLASLKIEYLLPGHSTQYGDMLQGEDKVAQNFAFIRINYFPVL